MDLDPSAASRGRRHPQPHPNAAMGWDDSLAAMIDADPKTRDSIWQGVSLALAALADPRVLDAVTPGPHEHFDPETFLTDQGTPTCSPPGRAGASASLVAAFVEDLIETARRLAARSPGRGSIRHCCSHSTRSGNLARCRHCRRSWPKVAAPASRPCRSLQSLARARDRWSEHQAGAIWDASIVKIILGGASSSRDLKTSPPSSEGVTSTPTA